MQINHNDDQIYGQPYRRWWHYRFNGVAINELWIYVDLIQTPAGSYDCWIDGKHCPDTVTNLTEVTTATLTTLAGQPIEMLAMRSTKTTSWS